MFHIEIQLFITVAKCLLGELLCYCHDYVFFNLLQSSHVDSIDCKGCTGTRLKGVFGTDNILL